MVDFLGGEKFLNGLFHMQEPILWAPDLFGLGSGLLDFLGPIFM